MSTTNGVFPIPSSGIVPELLNQKNYEEWSFRLHTYFMAQDLWDIIMVESTSDEAVDKAWMKNNATALHAIHISCGPHAFSLIKNINNAKLAWDKLASMAPEREPQILQPIQDHNIILTDDEVRQLYTAVCERDWRTTNWIITNNPSAVRAKITHSGRTALHVAAMVGHLRIVKLLVQNMSEEDLEIKDGDGFTALAIAIIANAKPNIAECMVRKNIQILVTKVNDHEMLPAAMAFRYGHKEMGRYLYTITPLDHLQQNRQDCASIICNAIRMQSFDVALELLNQDKELATTCEKPIFGGRPPVDALANLPSAFLSGCRLKFWQRWLYHCICINSTCVINDILSELKNQHIYNNESLMRSGTDLPSKDWSKFGGLTLDPLKILGIKDLYEMKLVHIQTSELLRHMYHRIKFMDLNQSEKGYVKDSLFQAVDRGNVEFVKSIVQANPELVETRDKSLMNIFMHAIQFRQPQIFSLIYNVKSKLSATSAIDRQRNNMLHLAAKLAPNPQLNGIQGAVLQMQRELQWFQEVKSIVPPWALDHKNSNGKTPGEIFTEDHKKLVIEGEKWMKETATSCTVVGALIVTIMFAAAFTVPGGNNEDSGFPIFLNKKLFMIFIISDAISLFSSTTSVLMFMGILTSRYEEQDFLYSLPRKLMIGLFTLFLSIASMMVAFSATLFIVLKDKYSWIIIPVICLASIPVTLFVFMQFRLLVDIFLSTYGGGGIFNKNAKIFVRKNDRKRYKIWK